MLNYYFPELANLESDHQAACVEERNKRVVGELYKALLTSKEETVLLHGLVAQDLEWWFHGPSCHWHHLVPWLTGHQSKGGYLVPDHVVGFGSVVVAEGYDEDNLVWWVHAWTVNADGVIIQVKEYVNTSLTVTRLRMPAPINASNNKYCQSIWQSTLCDESVPGLILAI